VIDLENMCREIVCRRIWTDRWTDERMETMMIKVNEVGCYVKSKI
jgi:hypothetical protein